ncbi:hypothetical protein V1478_013416 [Vespula squamosa]|uniref:Uncharacterized protein n=1 Tax=Vespula squamosa TaxID=30214 RepID=A0ABD2AAS2_VESSQ
MKVISFGENDCIEYNFITSVDFSDLMIQKSSSRLQFCDPKLYIYDHKNTFSTLKEHTFYCLK